MKTVHLEGGNVELGLKGRVVLLAASSDGIALAAAEKFAAEGAKLAMCARNGDKLKAAAEGIRKRYAAEVIAEPFDVIDESAVTNFVQQVASHFGSVDICIANAGGPPAKMFLSTTNEEWQRAVALNLMSTIHFARAVIPHMQQKKWGRIVTITGVAVRQPLADLIYSNTVRAGVVGLVKSLSNEFGKDGITVNNVAPGFTATGRLQSLVKSRAAAANVSEEEYAKSLGADAALKRVGQPEEVADAIVWLASERASYITGQTLLVDGGQYKGV